jgi:hypothetical protein
MRKPRPKYISLPPDFCPVNCTFDEACSYARHSRWQGHVKVRAGRWEVFKDGRKTIVIFASVLADEARMKAASAPVKEPAKRPVGRPRKSESAAASAG